MVAFPYGDIEPRFMRSLIFLLKWDHDHHDRIFDGGAYLQLQTTNVAHGRNQIVRHFLDLPGKPDWLWFIDTDMDFQPDTLDRLVESADPVKRPILGGLCFALMKGDAQEVVPTLYAWTDDDPPLPARVTRLPAEGVHPVAATGTGCLLIHRSVLEAVEQFSPHGATPFGERAFPWFEWSAWATADGTDVMGEDLTFCFRAGAAGFPTHVDTSIKVGHVKPVVIDEGTYDAQFATATQTPVNVVIPMKDKHGLTSKLVGQLRDQGEYDRLYIYDNGSQSKQARNWLASVDGKDRIEVIDADGWNIHEMWNDGLRRSLHADVAVLNNDLTVGPAFLSTMAKALNADPRCLAVCGNYDGREGTGVVPLQGICGGDYSGSGGFAGFAYMVHGKAFDAGFPFFDEDLGWFFGDTELILTIQRMGGWYGMALDAVCTHVDGGSQTTGAPCGAGAMADQYKADEATFRAKWQQPAWVTRLQEINVA